MNSTFKSPRSKHIVRTSGQKLKSVVCSISFGGNRATRKRAEKAKGPKCCTVP